MRDFVIVDVETTGGKPGASRITDIALVFIKNNCINGHYSTLVNPNREIDQYVQKITHITNKMVRNAPKFYQIAEEIDFLTNNSILVGHNIRFDYSMIRSEFNRLGINYERETIDTINMARKALPELSLYNLDAVTNYLDIEISNRHRALGDAEATAKLFLQLYDMCNCNLENSLKIPYHFDE
ncbi:MAG: 3'-5' exonuclease [Bacteroidales bacterium]|jgi:DNA polymerase-3 subunit epsilon|nr:3'-5' exonuclease [Bacteroidales bacterium]